VLSTRKPTMCSIPSNHSSLKRSTRKGEVADA
jgi:hypothetical protein